MSSPGPLFTGGGDGVWLPSQDTRGPWDPAALHGGAPAALLGGLLEAHEPGAGMVVVRLALEFFGAVPMADLTVRGPVVVKPGRRFQVLEAELVAADRTVVVARAVRLRRAELNLPAPGAAGQAPRDEATAARAPAPAPADQPLPPPSAAREDPGWAPSEEGGFHRTGVEVRFAGGAPGSGAAAAWFRLRRPVMAGVAPTPLQRVAAAADFGNGISHALPFGEYLFANCDLTVHLHREPDGEWIGVDARTDLGETGVAQATSVLHDERGRIGIAAQSLFVEAR